MLTKEQKDHIHHKIANWERRNSEWDKINDEVIEYFTKHPVAPPKISVRFDSITKDGGVKGLYCYDDRYDGRIDMDLPKLLKEKVKQFEHDRNKRCKMGSDLREKILFMGDSEKILQLVKEMIGE